MGVGWGGVVFFHPVRNTDFGYSRKEELYCTQPHVLQYSQLHLIVRRSSFNFSI